MKKSVFRITKMDCLAEEQLIRMKLEPLSEVLQLDFDIPNRKLFVYHNGEVDNVQQAVRELHLNDVLEESVETEAVKSNSELSQRKMLWWVLGINFGFFVIEMIFGWLSDSMGLVADSLDMLADALVYALSLFAVGAAISRKQKVATISGYFQMVLAGVGLIEVVRRFTGFRETPVFQTMILISLLALIANSISLYLIQKAKSKEAHMQASMIFTANDIIINAGVILAGVLVYFTSSRFPDLIIGSLIFLIVIRGAFRILNLAK